jgi:hypothetical protein
VKPDPEGLAIYNALSTAFLDAYLRKDGTARDYLTRVDLPALTKGRAALTVE